MYGEAGRHLSREHILTHIAESRNPGPSMAAKLARTAPWRPGEGASLKNYDVVILGGAFSGAAAAILLRRDRPDLSVLVVEQAGGVRRQGGGGDDGDVGDVPHPAAGDVAAPGARAPAEGGAALLVPATTRCAATPTPASPAAFQRSTVPSFQLRRDALDEHLLATAVAEGAELVAAGPGARRRRRRLRPPRRPSSTRGRRETVAAAGCSTPPAGPTSSASKLGLIERNASTPPPRSGAAGRTSATSTTSPPAGRSSSRAATSARAASPRTTTWASATGSGSSPSATARPASASSSTPAWSTSTAARTARSDYLAFLRAIPAAAELLEGREPRLDDLRLLLAPRLRTRRQYMGNGWALLGDAAAFLDPYYSPGLDHASFTVEATVEIVKAQTARGGRRRPGSPSTTRRSSARTTASSRRSTRTSTTTWASTTCSRASFLIDTAQYYIFVVIPAYRLLEEVPLDAGARAEAGVHQLSHDADLQPALQGDRAGAPRRRRGRARATTAAGSRRSSTSRAPRSAWPPRGSSSGSYAELDNVRLSLKRLFAGKPAAVAGEEMPVEDS